MDDLRVGETYLVDGEAMALIYADEERLQFRGCSGMVWEVLRRDTEGERPRLGIGK